MLKIDVLFVVFIIVIIVIIINNIIIIIIIPMFKNCCTFGEYLKRFIFPIIQ